MEKIWLSSYPENVAKEIDESKLHKSLIEMCEETFTSHPEHVAYISMGKKLTFKEVDELSRDFAAYLQNELKLNKGDRVAIMVPNLLQYPIAFLGIIRAGLIAINVNPLYTPRELEHQLNDAGAKAIVIVANFAHTLEKIIKNTAVEHVIMSQIGDLLTPVKRFIINVGARYIKRMVPTYHLKNTISFRSVLAKGKQLEYNRPEIEHDDIALLQYTGGTTGIAKGAMLTHKNLLANIEQAYAAFNPILSINQEFVVTALPLYHIFALTINCLLFIRIAGSNLLIPNPRDLNAMINVMRSHKFTAITGVNTLFAALMNHEKFKKLDFSSLHLSIGGGMSIHQSVAEKWKKLTGCSLLEGYGLTECSPIVIANPYNMAHFDGSIGLPLPSTDVCLVDEEYCDVPIGEAGELLIKGPQVMKGYWEKPNETNDVMKAGWFCTGDIATMDENGFIRIVDRKKEMIIVSGFNVYPNEVEQVISLHNKVLEVAVIGIPDNISGERVKACIVAKDKSLTAKEIRNHCYQHLTAYKVPKEIQFYDELPKSTIGKIMKRILREQQ